jgi:hypothetical protein
LVGFRIQELWLSRCAAAQFVEEVQQEGDLGGGFRILLVRFGGQKHGETGSTFPFFAPPQQPRPTGVIDDNTRN